ncbi:hypothetical protein PSAB_13135 [Paenibacillus sabinae T27]|uniref:Uncharacterized protein n=1 Tax=Paenibacillus sabinae T27 TaxID=1268072 RepID=X4ZLI2_9BACL|nr:hypothetical protein PSAB_13135 [Paenibacillus sabinae T27]
MDFAQEEGKDAIVQLLKLADRLKGDRRGNACTLAGIESGWEELDEKRCIKAGIFEYRNLARPLFLFRACTVHGGR